MNKLIINADDFGYSFGVNKGIIEAHLSGIVTSTSVMVKAVAAQEAAGLSQYPELSVGLHFMLGDSSSTTAELQKQVQTFKAITGKAPDHIDVHKSLDFPQELEDVLRAYSREHSIPVRKLGFAKFIRSYFGMPGGDVSVERFKLAVDEATEAYNEIMCHVGYCDDYLREHSSYNELREQELKTLCDPVVKDYITQKKLQLINWRAVKV
jgi:chitin disaccharide deacetylase